MRITASVLVTLAVTAVATVATDPSHFPPPVAERKAFVFPPGANSSVTVGGWTGTMAFGASPLCA